MRENAVDDDIITRDSTGAQSDNFPHWLSAERHRLAPDFMKKLVPVDPGSELPCTSEIMVRGTTVRSTYSPNVLATRFLPTCIRDLGGQPPDKGFFLHSRCSQHSLQMLTDDRTDLYYDARL